MRTTCKLNWFTICRSSLQILLHPFVVCDLFVVARQFQQVLSNSRFRYWNHFDVGFLSSRPRHQCQFGYSLFGLGFNLPLVLRQGTHLVIYLWDSNWDFCFQFSSILIPPFNFSSFRVVLIFFVLYFINLFFRTGWSVYVWLIFFR